MADKLIFREEAAASFTLSEPENWIMNITPEGKFEFNRADYPLMTEDDFAKKVIDILQMSLCEIVTKQYVINKLEQVRELVKRRLNYAEPSGGHTAYLLVIEEFMIIMEELDKIIGEERTNTNTK